MASNARIFFAGIGTTFLIIGAGFGGGLMFAKSTLHGSAAQVRAVAQAVDPVRVILPTTAEAAQPPQQPVSAAVSPSPPAFSPPILAVEQVPDRQIDKVSERKKADAEEQRSRKRRYAERKARRVAEAKARQPLAPREQQSIMAFGGDEPRMGGFFGN